MVESAGGRDIIFISLFGSHNYDMANEHSDKDYKVFVAPSFDDLMKGKRFSSNVVGADTDYTVADIRNLPLYLFKTNINFLETLFSKDYLCESDSIQYFLDNRERIARMNLRYFYNSNRGMAYNKNKNIHKFNDGSRYMEQEYGYNVKEAAHSLRVLTTYTMFKDNGFKDFEDAIKLKGYEGPLTHDVIMSVKNGEVSEEDYQKLYAEAASKYDKIIVTSLPEPDMELYEKLQDLTYQVCRNHL